MRCKLFMVSLAALGVVGVAVGQPVMQVPALKVQYGGINLQGIAEQVIRGAAENAMRGGQPAPVYRPPTPAPAPQKKNQPIYTPSYSATAPKPKQTQKTTAPLQAAAAKTPDVNGFPLDTKIVVDAPNIRPITVPIYKGKPISGYDLVANTAETRVRQFDLVRWFSLNSLAARPELFDNPESALGIAKFYLAKDQWDNYLDCGAGFSEYPCFSGSRKNMDLSMQTSLPAARWKGKNEFQVEQSYQAFVADYRELLASLAPTLPMELYVVAGTRFGIYSAKQGGFPLSWDGGLFGNSGTSEEAGSLRTMPLAGRYTAPVFVSLPRVLPCQAQECEGILNLVPQRLVYSLINVRITHLDSKSTEFGGANPQTSEQTKAELLGGISIFADQGLSNAIHTFGALKTITAAQTMDSKAWDAGFTTGPVLLNADTLHLLWMKHNPGWRSTTNLAQVAAEMHNYRRQTEAAYYQIAKKTQWPDYDPWGPYFTANDTARSASVKADESGRFLDWSEHRVKALPRSLIARFWLQGKLNLPVTPLFGSDLDAGGLGTSSFVRLHDNEKVAKLLDENGVAPSANIIPLRFYSSLSLQATAIVLPKALDSYSFSRDLKQALPSGSDSAFSEIELEVDQVKFWPTKSPWLMLVYVTPKKWRAVVGPTLIAQGDLPLASAAEPEATAYDVLGVTLGMPFETADGLMREYLSPDIVEDWKAQPPSRGYDNARHYISQSKKERIVLYASIDNKVAAIERIVAGLVGSNKDVVAQILEKYGQPQKKSGSSDDYEWWSHQMADYCYSHDSQRTDVLHIEGVFKGKQSVGSGGLTMYPRNGARVKAAAFERCGPILNIRVSNSMNLTLYDHKAYAQTLDEQAQAPEDKQPKLKF